MTSCRLTAFRTVRCFTVVVVGTGVRASEPVM